MLPPETFGSESDVFEDAVAFDLSPGSMYSGTGVNTNPEFDSSVAGDTANAIYTNENGMK